MANGIDIHVITQDDCIESGCIDFPSALRMTEKALMDYSKGKILFPDKISQIFDETSQNRINCLPATLLEEKICGVKWVSVFPTNAAISLQNLTAVIILSSLDNGFPVAFMEGTLCSNIRTATISAVAAKYFANPKSEKIGFVGAGQQARFHFMALKSLYPSITECYVASRTSKSEDDFISDLSKLYPDTEFIACGSDYRRAVSGMDIFVSAISGQSPIIQAEWITSGSFYSHVGGWEDSYDVPQKADKIICDDWDSVKHRTQTLSRAYMLGFIDDGNITCNLPDAVSGKYKNEYCPDEFVYFNAVGLSYVDVALANYMFKRCKEQNHSRIVTLQGDSLFKSITEKWCENGNFGGNSML